MSLGQPYDPAMAEINFWTKCLNEGMAAEFSPDQYSNLTTRKQQDAFCQQKLSEAQAAHDAKHPPHTQTYTEINEQIVTPHDRFYQPEAPEFPWEVRVHLDSIGNIRRANIYHHGKNVGERQWAGDRATLMEVLTWANRHTRCDAGLEAKHLSLTY